MSHYIGFFIGMIVGVLIASYAWNKYYLGEIGELRRRIMLEELRIEEKKAEREWTKHQVEIHKLWDGAR